MKDKIQVAVKAKGLYLKRSDLLRNVFFMDRLKNAVMKLVLWVHMFFFSFNFFRLFNHFFPVLMSSTSS